MFVVRHFELACEQPATGKERGKEQETRRNCQGFRFPNTGNLCRVRINYLGGKHNHIETRAILHKLHSYDVDLTILHKIRKSVN